MTIIGGNTMKRFHRVAQVSKPGTSRREGWCRWVQERTRSPYLQDISRVGIDHGHAFGERTDAGFQRARGRASAHRDHAIAEGRAKFRMVLTMTEKSYAHQ